MQSNCQVPSNWQLPPLHGLLPLPEPLHQLPATVISGCHHSNRPLPTPVNVQDYAATMPHGAHTIGMSLADADVGM
ncbi:hypothetical protein Nepgr_029530 [Nepenthes gracilis]|uniref:Uncharacterized protein n=1 Tax=Nepenthes gracilis TaxID=150966 RepID=A0AAD3Y333_NEPGR|nr:hypothetical protein Nepgr_029530 [Nepenthes gracilis]